MLLLSRPDNPQAQLGKRGDDGCKRRKVMCYRRKDRCKNVVTDKNVQINEACAKLSIRFAFSASGMSGKLLPSYGVCRGDPKAGCRHKGLLTPTMTTAMYYA
jgi:hypothetical protein